MLRVLNEMDLNWCTLKIKGKITHIIFNREMDHIPRVGEKVFYKRTKKIYLIEEVTHWFTEDSDAKSMVFVTMKCISKN